MRALYSGNMNECLRRVTLLYQKEFQCTPLAALALAEGIRWHLILDLNDLNMIEKYTNKSTDANICQLYQCLSYSSLI